MTTLPQNTPLRAPRLSAGGQVAPAAGGAAPGSQLTGADVLRILRGHLWMIVIFLVLFTIGGFGLNFYLSKYHSRYTAKGLLEVFPERQLALRSEVRVGDPNLVLRAQRTQANLVMQERLWSQVLASPTSPIRQTAWFRSFGGDIPEAKEDLAKNFGASVVVESNLISVQMTDSNAEDARVVLQEIVDAHIQSRRDRNVSDRDSKTRQLNDELLRLRSELRTEEGRRQQLAAQLSADGSDPEGRLGSKEIELQGLVTEQLTAQIELSATSAALNSIQTALQNDQIPPQIQGFVEQDPQYRQLNEQVQQLQLALASQLPGTESSTQVVRLKQQLEANQKALENLKEELTARARVEVPENLKGSEASIRGRVEALAADIRRRQVELGELTNRTSEYRVAVQREGGLREQLASIEVQLNTLNQVGRGGQQDVDWAIMPVRPDVPSFPKLAATLSASIVVGLALAIGIAFLSELGSTTVRSPRDISRVGNLNLLGMIPHIDDDPQTTGAKLPLVIFEAPASMTAEQFRQVRTRLQQTIPLDNARSLLVTSPGPGDGKTTIAANMAAGMALVGRKILLVDANFRRPELHKLFGLDNGSGLSNALVKPETFAASVKETSVPNLFVMPTGTKPSNGTELLESQLLNDFMAKALADYDHVVFDSGPILFTSETVALAPKVDGVVTVVRAGSNTRGVLGRTKDLLRSLKAENLGVVLNGVRAVGGGYYARNIKTYYQYSNQSQA